MRGLWQNCRVAKENLLQSGTTKKQPISILGRGSSVIGGAIKTDLTYEEVEATLVDGFFPRCEANEMPKSGRRVGLQEMGLPYAADPAVTRHLAKFLTRQKETSGDIQTFAHPTAILFNGGVMKATLLRQRLVDVLNGWLSQEGSQVLRTLEGTNPDHAVARGAAYYGLARRGKGIRIRGGAARSYYIGIETSMPAVPGMAAPLKALCVAPFGMEEGTESDIPGQEFGLVVGEPAQFRFLGSTTRRGDQVGTFIEEPGDDIEELTPLETTLSWIGQEGVPIPARLRVHLTEVGTLELWAVSRDETHRWKLEFNVRSTGEE